MGDLAALSQNGNGIMCSVENSPARNPRQMRITEIQMKKTTSGSRAWLSSAIAAVVLLSLFLGGLPSSWSAQWITTIQRETAPGSQLYHRIDRPEAWSPSETAIIVCDMWDSHHCLNAVRRVKQLAPRIDQVLRAARKQGATIIHAPSSCMEFYREHPARARAVAVPKVAQLPKQINEWCSKIPAEEKGEYPIDQSQGGEDDDPIEHQQWADQLKARGRDPRRPWKRQIATIVIDEERDYISDKGDEIWSILQHKGIRQVVLCGVHTNMCVLGRPFGLRQMVRNKMPVVLIRDLTDTMYNPERSPYVSHFSGTDLIIDHIERHICPTITSRAFLKGKHEFRFRGDRRSHIVLVMAEDEYGTPATLTKFAAMWLRRNHRVSLVYANADNRNDLPGLTRIHHADLLIMSIRRRVLPPKQMNWFREHIANGKPVVALRTSSHAFHLRNQEPPKGLEDWPAFDAEVLGGNYQNHYPNKIPAVVTLIKSSRDHAVLDGIDVGQFPAGGSLYKTSPLAVGTHLLADGRIAGKAPEPVAWTFIRRDGGRTFYAALGHVKDFENKSFVRMLRNAVAWSLGETPPPSPVTPPRSVLSRR